jgi:hypothetical protein
VKKSQVSLHEDDHVVISETPMKNKENTPVKLTPKKNDGSPFKWTPVKYKSNLNVMYTPEKFKNNLNVFTPEKFKSNLYTPEKSKMASIRTITPDKTQRSERGRVGKTEEKIILTPVRNLKRI